MNIANCPNHSCGTSLPYDANYCPQCGKNLKVNSRKFISSLCIALLIGVAGFISSSYFIGQKPVQKEQLNSEMPQEIDPLIEGLKSQAQTAPQDINRWRAVSEAIKAKLLSSPNQSQSLIFDLIDSYRGILAINPKDEASLLGMAEISYEQQAFDKASEFYALYMSLRPDDLKTKANYASALSFAGKSDEAISQLRSILKIKPKDFQATAFLSIAYARKGDMKKATEVGNEALSYAPDDEAKKRLSSFISSLSKPQSSGKESKDSPVQAQNGGASVVESPSGQLLQLLMNHPIVGPKIKSHEFQNETLILIVENFPMSAMPENAKKAFQTKLIDASRGINNLLLKRIVFKDFSSGEILGEIPLNQ